MHYLLSIILAISSFSPKHQQIQNELNYYLQRHSVQDEGFDMVARYAEEGDSTLAAYMPKGKLKLTSFLRLKDYPREGKCLTKDMYGRIIIGQFHADTLMYGIRIDAHGTYAGQFNRHMMASGHGSEWQAPPVFLLGESWGQGSLVGCRLWGRTESDMTEAT